MAASGSSRCYAGAISFAEGSLAPRLKKDSSVAKSKKHKDVKFAVEREGTLDERIFDTLEEAAGHAVSLAASTGSVVYLDALVSSKAGCSMVDG